MNKCVRVCQNRTCIKQGAAAVLEAFHKLAVADVTVLASGCLGQCGNGPMVLVLPEMVWYCRVRSPDVPHLLSSEKVTHLLYQRFH